MKFGRARLYRQDTSISHRLHYHLFGLADPGHYLRSHYFKKYSKLLRPKKILDAGCGGGDYTFYMAEHWPQATIEAIDINQEAVTKNRSVQKRWGLENIAFKELDLKQIHEEETYDLIVCIDVLEHIVDQKVIIDKFYSALKKGGHLYIHIPLKRSRPVPLEQLLKKFQEWAEQEHIGEERSRDQMLGLINKSGFIVEKSQYTFYHHYGELANSLFCIFYEDTLLNRVLQGLIAPIVKLLCYNEMIKVRDEGYALAVLAKK